MLTLLLVLLSNAYFFNENVTLLYLNTIASVYLHPIQKNVINSLVFFFCFNTGTGVPLKIVQSQPNTDFCQNWEC